MAIYFPELFCNKGQSLKVKKDIIYENGTVVHKGEICYVVNIVEYGFDILTSKKIELRFLNSEMPEFFEKVNLEMNSDFRFVISNSPAFNKIVNDLSGSTIAEKLVKEQNVIMFTSDFMVRNANVTFYKGDKFFYIEDDGYYNLYDVNSYRKVLRMNAKEVAQYCQLQTAPAEAELV